MRPTIAFIGVASLSMAACESIATHESRYATPIEVVQPSVAAHRFELPRATVTGQPMTLLTNREAVREARSLAAASPAVAQKSALLATLFHEVVAARSQAGVSRFVFQNPTGPGWDSKLAGSELQSLRIFALSQFDPDRFDIVWDDGTIEPNPDKLPFATRGRTEWVVLDFDWIAPDGGTAYVFLRSSGDQRATIRRVIATWAGSLWAVRDASPGRNW